MADSPILFPQRNADPNQIASLPALWTFSSEINYWGFMPAIFTPGIIQMPNPAKLPADISGKEHAADKDQY
jgi:hypothetical protein